MIHSARFVSYIFPLLFVFFSCSYLPQGVQVPDQEAGRVKAEFEDTIASQKECSQCLNARMVISLKSTWFSGSMDGYLQVMPPASLKYVALNPLGQTQLVLVSDGDSFHLLSLPEKKSYRGELKPAESGKDRSFTKYVPAGFPFDRSFYLFTGRIFSGPVEIVRVRKAREEEGYWLEIGNDNDSRSLVLFDDLQRLIRQYIILDREGRESLKLVYENYSQEGGCNLPGIIKISSREQRADIKLRLMNRRKSSCSEDDFHYQAPASFEEVHLD
ncbi:MAG: DUF4292 domain-containing protein [Desulfurivibrionaceae bacterium]